MGTKSASGRMAGLTSQQRAFVRQYDANGGNGTRAYFDSHPGCNSYGAAATEAGKLLKNPEIRRSLTRLESARWKRLRMSTDEALARLAADARADIRELFDDDGNLLPVRDWPESVAQSVKSFRQTPTGPVIQMNDSLAARRILLERLEQGTSNPVGQLARLLTVQHEDEDIERGPAGT